MKVESDTMVEDSGKEEKEEIAAERVEVAVVSSSNLSADDDHVQKKEEEVTFNSSTTDHDDSSEQAKGFYQDFFGFSSEEWSRKISSPLKPQQQQQSPSSCVIRKQQQRVGKKKKKGDKMNNKEIANPVFRSKSVSFKYMRFKIGSSNNTATGTKRSKSVPALASKSKSRWQVFMSGFGSGRYPTKIDLVDIKSRQQLHRHNNNNNITNNKVSTPAHDVVVKSREEVESETGGRSTVWYWLLVDVLGCRGRYATDIKEVIV